MRKETFFSNMSQQEHLMKQKYTLVERIKNKAKIY